MLSWRWLSLVAWAGEGKRLGRFVHFMPLDVHMVSGFGALAVDRATIVIAAAGCGTAAALRV